MLEVTNPVTRRSPRAVTSAPDSIVMVLLLLAVAAAVDEARATKPMPSLLPSALTLIRPSVSMTTSDPERLAPFLTLIVVLFVTVAMASGLPTSMNSSAGARGRRGHDAVSAGRHRIGGSAPDPREHSSAASGQVDDQLLAVGLPGRARTRSGDVEAFTSEHVTAATGPREVDRTAAQRVRELEVGAGSVDDEVVATIAQPADRSTAGGHERVVVHHVRSSWPRCR